MAQIQEADLVDISTPGLGQRCLYYAALLSLNKDATEETTRALKKQVHDKIEDFLISSDVGVDAANEIKNTISQKKI
mgnify:CR=1 FL=1